MTKIVLGKRPDTFKRAVSFPMLDGSTGKITVDYVYRTKSEFGMFIDDLLEKAKIEPTTDAFGLTG